MTTTASSWVSALAITIIVTGWTSAAGGRTPRVDRAQAAEQAYAWADSCKTCHKEIFDAWAKTKHARALERLKLQ
jgi:Cytochrome c554 and c-prime